MNCNTCRYELSQCLDGRLPSGRRTLVMQHAETCASCSEFWTELQAAQQLTLRLSQPHVSEGFREGLWQRIQAGEGTPEAVFHEPVPMWTKIRYTLTGAAAAAAALLAVTLLRHDDAKHRSEDPLVSSTGGSSAPDGGVKSESIASSSSAGGNAVQVENLASGSGSAGVGLQDRTPSAFLVADNPLIASTQPLTFNLVARETARQLEQRHAAVSTALRLMVSPNANRDAAVSQAIENAREFRAFGELLLDMRDRKRLIFTDSLVDADLRVAVNMLAQDPMDRTHRQDLRTVQTIVAPALQSDRLANLSGAISLVLPSSPREELDALMRLNTQRPEMFRMLFFVFGSDEDLHLLRPGMAFFMQDMCGPSWVAPRSEVEARDGILRMLRHR